MMTVSKGPSKLDLVPWDFNSEEHTQRAFLQRVACGWRWDEIPDWVEKCKKGKMMVYWLVSLAHGIPIGHNELLPTNLPSKGHLRQRPRPRSPNSNPRLEIPQGQESYLSHASSILTLNKIPRNPPP